MINVLICADKKYLKIATTTLFSIRCNTDEPIRCYLCQKGIDQKDLDIFAEKLKKIQIETVFVEFKLSLDNLVTGDMLTWTIETYYRLFAQFYLPRDIDRVLYLDGDIVALGDISELYYQDFDGKAIVACRDIAETYQKTRLKMPEESVYVNAGVMLLNLAWLRENTTEQGIVQQISELYPILQFHDQDLINLKYNDHIKAIAGDKYNYHCRVWDKIKKKDDVILLHYAGREKPWNLNGCYYKNTRFYWGYRIRQYPLSVFKWISLYFCLLFLPQYWSRYLFHTFFPDKHPLQLLKKQS